MYPKSEVIKRWHKMKLGGRLCWKRANWRWRNTFESDDVAVWFDPPVRMHFKALSAIVEFLDYCEWVTKQEATEKNGL